jgi:hypothetical protein
MTGGRLITRLAGFVFAASFVAAISCSSDASIAPDPQSSASQTGGNGNDSSTTPPATSNGPVASVVVSPKQVSVPQGYYTRLSARPLDGKGVLVAGKLAQWRSSDANIAVPSDTGIIYGKAMGSAKVYATVDGHTDSATIIVTAPVPPPPPPPPPTDSGKIPQPVAKFALNVVVVGVLSGRDTSATEPVGGVTVTATRFTGVSGDTLNPSVLVGTAVTNAGGEVSFKDLPGGSYSIVATPAASSPYRGTSWVVLAPRSNEVNIRMVLQRK